MSVRFKLAGKHFNLYQTPMKFDAHDKLPFENVGKVENVGNKHLIFSHNVL